MQKKGPEMKHLKHLFAAALAMFVALAIAVPAFAAGTGSITITPPEDVDTSATITYKVYKVFDADGNGTAISYKLVSGKTEAPAGFTVDTAGNVTYTGTGTGGQLTQADIDAIAGYVTNADLVATVTSTGGTAAVAENLPNGYYYITTTTGTAVTINSTNPNVSVNDKNTVPGVDKKITGAVSIDEAGKKAIQEVGKEVEYTATITVGKGSKDLKFHDVMGTGLEYVAGSATVTGVDADQYEILGTPETGDTITIKFADGIAEKTVITVTYKAKVTSAALQVDPAKNTATVSYGENSAFTSEPSETETYNAKITITKLDDQEKPLAGAGFVIKNADGAYFKLAADGKSITWYTLGADEKLADAIAAGKIDEHKSGSDGVVPAFEGLATGKYTIVESTVPAGFNKAADQDIEVGPVSSDMNLELTASVINRPGSVLPSTGGIGTTIFYVVGGALVITAGVLLVTKRRMANVEA